MSAWLLAVAVVVVMLLGISLWLRLKANKTVAPAVPKIPKKTFHGVSIRPTSGACRAAQLVANKRFLPNEAPALPLRECDVSYCGCRYEHYQDRRAHDDRRHVHIDIETKRSGKEHREDTERRQGRKYGSLGDTRPDS